MTTCYALSIKRVAQPLGQPAFLSVAVTAEYYKQCYDYYPDDVVIVEKIAQTVHGCSSVYNFTEKPRHSRRALRWYYMTRRAKMLQQLKSNIYRRSTKTNRMPLMMTTS